MQRSTRKAAVRQSSDVRFSDRGFAFSETGQGSKARGIIGFFARDLRPPLNTLPEGILIYNTTDLRLELSDPDNNQWIVYSGSALAGSAIGTPTDGSYADGAVSLTETTTIADAVDLINEYLLTITGGGSSFVTSGTALNQTLRWNGSSYVPNSTVRADGSGLGVQGLLAVSGGFTSASGTTPTASGSAGSVGEFRWDNGFLYVHTNLGWARVAINYF